MNLRILKKLSKRAAPLLPLLGDDRQQFRASKPCMERNYHGAYIGERKHWERSRTHPEYTAISCEEIVWNTRAGHRCTMRPSPHPLKGTMMVGATTGYYEPEWNEECAYEALCKVLMWTFVEYDYEADDVRPTRSLATPALVFEAAQDAIAEIEAESGAKKWWEQ